MDGGIVVIVSYNFKDYNGMKMVGKGLCLISFDNGFLDIKDCVRGDFEDVV